MTRIVAMILIGAVLAACGSRLQEAGSGSTATPGSPQPSASASPTPTPSASPSPSPSANTVPFPSLPVIVGTAAGDIYFDLQNGSPAGPKRHVCDGTVSNIATFGRQAAINCGSGQSGAALYLWDEASGSITKIADTDIQQAAFDGQGSLAYVVMGRTEPTAPISMTKLMLRDLRTGTTTALDERYGVAFELRRTGRGIAVWRPKNSLSFVRPDSEAGTWLIRGTTLVKYSQHRLIDGREGVDLLESEPGPNSSGATYVVWKTTAEQRLTPSTVANERAVAITSSFQAVAWRPATSEFEGSMVIYDGTNVTRTDRGRFSAYKAAQQGDWIVGLEYSGAPSLTLTAYRLSDGVFAAQPANGFTAFALLGEKK